MWGPAGHEEMRQKMQIPKPKKLSEVPSYLRRLVGGFFYRLFYIFRLVWEAKPYILFVMIFHALFSGFAPVFNAYLGKWLLDALSEVITGAAIGVLSYVICMKTDAGRIFLRPIAWVKRLFGKKTEECAAKE